ncbi:MAG: UTP--glucose-1-phosphate uridylyltransferase [Phycisphaerales bacterium]
MPTADAAPRIAEAFAAQGQGHVLRHLDALAPDRREALLDQLAEVDLALMARLVAGGEEAKPDFSRLAPAPYVALGSPIADARAHGEALLRAGKVSAFTVAGGQGTRLGWKGPKGTYPATCVTGRPLFRVFAEQIAAAERRYSCSIPWYIMTSPLNDADTHAFFRDNNWFGRNPADTFLFPQGTMPSVTPDGKLILESPDALAVNPDGHGGAIRALAASGAIEDMRARGVEHVSYFQVDNPLVRIADPVFLGLHARSEGSSGEMSSKMVAKRDAAEKVGVFCDIGGRTGVVEYSDLPAELANAVDSTGALRFNAGSIAIHAISVAFLERLTSGGELALPFHRATKKVPYWCDERKKTVEPAEPNAIKFEAFVFDALALAAKSLVMETARVEEFAPIKNASGDDSPASSHQIQSNRNAAWLERYGVKIHRKPNGDADARIEILAETALDADDLADADLPREIGAGAEVVV